MNKLILIVDDEPNVRLSYRMTLETEGCTVMEAESGPKALELFSQHHFDLAILDLRMPEMDGLDLLGEMRTRGFKTPTVIITAYGEISHAVRAMRLGAIDFLSKPMTPESLRQVVGDVLLRHAGEAVTSEPKPDDLGSHLVTAKRLLNLQDFPEAWKHLTRALELDPQAPEALNLAGVLFEMQEDYDRAKIHYGKAIRYSRSYEPAQQNMRRLFELFNYGSSREPIALGDE